jgi:riboflavin synthase
MFTGLVEAVGELVECKPTSAGFRVRIQSALSTAVAPGDSLAVNGVCLTVILADASEIHADVGPQTVRVTTLGTLPRGSLVNLERPLQPDGRVGGHFVLGHVDAVGHIEELRPDAEFYWLTIGFPRELAPFMVRRGSVAVDGISLTVAGLGTDKFDVQVVPFTMEHTNLKQARVRDRVNLECDVIGKYVARAAELAGLSFAGASPGDAQS